MTVTSRMFIVWPWLLALGLLGGRGEAQSCTQAYGGPNLARGRPTSQSSTYSPVYSSSSAVDGICNQAEPLMSFSHTNLQESPWWSVDLGRAYAVSLVVVKNRMDCCGERIRGATVHVGHCMGDFGANSFVCGTITDLQDGSLTTIHCNAAVGRFITIVIPDREAYLSLREVEVYGTNPLPCC